MAKEQCRLANFDQSTLRVIWFRWKAGVAKRGFPRRPLSRFPFPARDTDALPFGRLWYGKPNAVSNAIGYAMHSSRSHQAVIRVYDAAGNVIEKHEHKGDFKGW